MNKKELIKFLIWMRNGVAFCTSWLLILWLIHNSIFNIENIATDSLMKMVLFAVGGVFIFSCVFTGVWIKKWRFLKRLNCFMVLFGIYEVTVFYCLGIGQEERRGGLAVYGIILISYLLCIIIYQLYEKKQGELYTQALRNYQQRNKRGTRDERKMV
ncbi:MAG: hypothetical protein IJP31_06365 [Lachnospiraceae bacterium]|nr:hypothetical protein [Lachnospiraceae bacterium]